MSKSRIEELMGLAIQPSSVTVQGLHTAPRSWGVYEVELSHQSRATRRFRFGNHPVRQRELEAEFGTVDLIALLSERAFAEELAGLLNRRSKINL